jgi:hypothetical protein
MKKLAKSLKIPPYQLWCTQLLGRVAEKTRRGSWTHCTEEGTGTGESTGMGEVSEGAVEGGVAGGVGGGTGGWQPVLRSEMIQDHSVRSQTNTYILATKQRAYCSDQEEEEGGEQEQEQL